LVDGVFDGPQLGHITAAKLDANDKAIFTFEVETNADANAGDKIIIEADIESVDQAPLIAIQDDEDREEVEIDTLVKLSISLQSETTFQLEDHSSSSSSSDEGLNYLFSHNFHNSIIHSKYSCELFDDDDECLQRRAEYSAQHSSAAE
jgi:hypothetical protein